MLTRDLSRIADPAPSHTERILNEESPHDPGVVATMAGTPACRHSLSTHATVEQLAQALETLAKNHSLTAASRQLAAFLRDRIQRRCGEDLTHLLDHILDANGHIVPHLFTNYLRHLGIRLSDHTLNRNLERIRQITSQLAGVHEHHEPAPAPDDDDRDPPAGGPSGRRPRVPFKMTQKAPETITMTAREDQLRAELREALFDLVETLDLALDTMDDPVDAGVASDDDDGSEEDDHCLGYSPARPTAMFAGAAAAPIAVGDAACCAPADPASESVCSIVVLPGEELSGRSNVPFAIEPQHRDVIMGDINTVGVRAAFPSPVAAAWPASACAPSGVRPNDRGQMGPDLSFLGVTEPAQIPTVTGTFRHPAPHECGSDHPAASAPISQGSGPGPHGTEPTHGSGLAPAPQLARHT